MGMKNSLCGICPPKNINRLGLKRGICSPPRPVPALRALQPAVNLGTGLRVSVLNTAGFRAGWILVGSDLVGLTVFIKVKETIDLANNSVLRLSSKWFQLSEGFVKFHCVPQMEMTLSANLQRWFVSNHGDMASLSPFCSVLGSELRGWGQITP